MGVLGGAIAGLLGVGGGVVFVPGMVLFLGLDQHQAVATSLLAIIPVAVLGTVRQDRYGTSTAPTPCAWGAIARGGRGRGGAANALPGSVLRDLFAAFMVLVAIRLVLETRRSETLSQMGLDNPVHIAFLVVILLLLFGAKRLPEIGRQLGSGMREFKDSVTGSAQTQQAPQQAALPQPTQVAAQPAPVPAPPAAPVT